MPGHQESEYALRASRTVYQLNNWRIETKYTETALAHEASLKDWETPTIWLIEPKDTCLVLGRSEREKPYLNFEYIRENNLNLTTRQSGGGAVLVDPQDILWVDVFIPKDSQFWEDDIAKASIRIGNAWKAALKEVKVSSSVYKGKFLRSELSDLVCFAGKGPGEIFREDKKMLGISQRRSKFGTRFQCALIIEWNPNHLIGAFNKVPIPNFEEEITAAGIASGCEKSKVLEAFIKSLTSFSNN